ncbi:MAG TPA: NAD(P)-dependent oxidoreductase [Burkholderiaceae bacterium]|jgi:3-hydroxyisobutyrate dehydrogenase
MNDTPRIGIIGIGAMGFAIATNLKHRGRAPRVRDVDPKAVAAAAAEGLVHADSPAALAAASDLIAIVVVDAAQIDAVLFGVGGVIHAPRRAQPPVVMICSTIAAGDTERFRDRLLEHGIALLDAPISGGPARAANGTMSMMLACERALFGRFEALLREMAGTLFYVGETVGDAARTKLVNNLLAGINLVAGAEALALGARLGLDKRALFEVIQASSGASWIVGDRMARALDGDYVPRARSVILTKDVGLAVQMAADAGLETPLGDEALRRFKATVAAGFGELDDAAVIRTICPDF